MCDIFMKSFEIDSDCLMIRIAYTNCNKNFLLFMEISMQTQKRCALMAFYLDLVIQPSITFMYM